MLKLLLIAIALAGLGGCASQDAKQVSEVPAEPPAVSRSLADIQKINALERQLAERQRQCLVDKRRQEVALKESQKQVDELEKKLDALLAIDRELRSTKKPR